MQDATAKTCFAWDHYTCGEYKLINNIWNPGSVVGYEQCIHSTPGGSICGFEWSWTWPSTGTNEVRAYPELLFGWKPWDLASTTGRLPLQLSAIEQLEANYSITTNSVGVHNTAFDLWITSEFPPTKEKITREVMVWVDSTGLPPAGGGRGEVSTPFGTFDLYKSNTSFNWTYLAFVLQGTLLSGTIDLAFLLKFLVDNGHITPTEYLTSISFGNELCWGNGRTSVHDYRIVM